MIETREFDVGNERVVSWELVSLHGTGIALIRSISLALAFVCATSLVAGLSPGKGFEKYLMLTTSVSAILLAHLALLEYILRRHYRLARWQVDEFGVSETVAGKIQTIAWSDVKRVARSKDGITVIGRKVRIHMLLPTTPQSEQTLRAFFNSQGFPC